MLFRDTTTMSSALPKYPAIPFPYTFEATDLEADITISYTMHGKIYATAKGGMHFYTISKMGPRDRPFIGKIDNLKEDAMIEVIELWKQDFGTSFVQNTGASNHFPVVVCYKRTDEYEAGIYIYIYNEICIHAI